LRETVPVPQVTVALEFLLGEDGKRLFVTALGGEQVASLTVGLFKKVS